MTTTEQPPLPDLATTNPVDLTQAVCDIASVSGDEQRLADAIEAALGACPHLEITRDGNAVVARTNAGKTERVIIAGHIDTVPIAQNLPTWRTTEDGEEVLWGRGTVDMKGGVGVALHLAAKLSDPAVDVTWVFYDLEEVDYDRNGLGRLAKNHPELLEADFAILGEPTAAGIEGGCNGNIRLDATTRGTTAHSARAWRGTNAVHLAAPILQRLADYEPATVDVEGLAYRESLGAVGITGGIATNMVPDRCTVSINYRYAPSKTPADAEAHVRELLQGLEVDLEVKDVAAGARPGLDNPLVADAIAALTNVTGGEVGPKYGWTDVARFSELGIPALNFGPGDPMLAHADDERCPTAQITMVSRALEAWLAPGGADRSN